MEKERYGVGLCTGENWKLRWQPKWIADYQKSRRSKMGWIQKIGNLDGGLLDGLGMSRSPGSYFFLEMNDAKKSCH